MTDDSSAPAYEGGRAGGKGGGQTDWGALLTELATEAQLHEETHDRRQPSACLQTERRMMPWAHLSVAPRPGCTPTETSTTAGSCP